MTIDWNEMAQMPRAHIKMSYAKTATDLIVNDECDAWDVAAEAIINGLSIMTDTKDPALMNEFADMTDRMVKRLRINAEQAA